MLTSLEKISPITYRSEPRNNTFCVFCVIPGMSKSLKLCAASYGRRNTKREENVTKYAGSTVAYIKTAEKRNKK